MKLINKIFLFALIAGSFAACRPSYDKVIGESRDVLSSLNGTWKITKATQLDQNAFEKGFPYQKLDITTLFPYTEFKLKLDVANGQPTTFTTTPGASPRIIKLASGTWTVDDINYPKVVTLTSGSTTEKFTIGGYAIAPNNTLTVTVQRSDATDNKLLIVYTYEFTKQ